MVAIIILPPVTTLLHIFSSNATITFNELTNPNPKLSSHGVPISLVLPVKRPPKWLQSHFTVLRVMWVMMELAVFFSFPSVARSLNPSASHWVAAWVQQLMAKKKKESSVGEKKESCFHLSAVAPASFNSTAFSCTSWNALRAPTLCSAENHPSRCQSSPGSCLIPALSSCARCHSRLRLIIRSREWMSTCFLCAFQHYTRPRCNEEAKTVSWLHSQREKPKLIPASQMSNECRFAQPLWYFIPFVHCCEFINKAANGAGHLRTDSIPEDCFLYSPTGELSLAWQPYKTAATGEKCLTVKKVKQIYLIFDEPHDSTWYFSHQVFFILFFFGAHWLPVLFGLLHKSIWKSTY